MQRRLIKLLEDVAVMYDKTVRTCDRKNIIQLRYGGDGIDPIKAEEASNPINLKSLEEYVKTILGFNMEKQNFLNPDELREKSR